MTVIFVLPWTMGLSIVIAASRQSWAFSRDGSLPFSNFFKVINEKYSSPIRCVWGNTLIAMCIGCLCMIDAAAAAALFSLSVGGNSLAWLIPISLKLFYGQESFIPGIFFLPWKNPFQADWRLCKSVSSVCAHSTSVPPNYLSSYERNNELHLYHSKCCLGRQSCLLLFDCV